jgi:HlyD family secretion protein
MKRRTLLYGAILVVAAAAILLLLRPAFLREPGPEVGSAIVVRGPLQVVVTASGAVQPRSRVRLAFDVSGTISQIAVSAGDVVGAGDVLAELNDAELRLQATQARAALDAAESQLAELRAGPDPAAVAASDANVRAAQARVGSAAAKAAQVEGGMTEAELASVRSDLASAVAQQKEAEDIHDLTMTCRTFTLPDGSQLKFCPGLGVPEEQARYSLEAADLALAAAQARLAEAENGADEAELRAAQASIWAAAAEREAVQAELDQLLAGATEGQIAAARAQVAQAEASLEEAELALEGAALRAPLDGEVAWTDLALGVSVGAGVPVVELVDNSTFYVTVSVDEIEVGRLAEGQEAVVTLEALPEEEIEGYVERIAPAARFEAGVVYYDVRIGLRETAVPVRADMTANATIVVEELKDVLQLPTWVVRVDRLDGQTYVDREVEGGTERVDVKLGLRYGGNAQVLEGLEEGDRIARVEGESGIQFRHP